MSRLLGLLAVVLSAAFAVQGSEATFTASAKNAGSAFTTAANFPPVVTLTTPAGGSATNDATPTLSGAAGNTTGDSSTVTVRIYSGSTATGTAVQTRTATRTAATWTNTLTTALATGIYTAQATQTDSSGNTGTSTANTFTVDTAKPTATKVVAANTSGGSAGQIASGDTITYTYSEPITAASVWSIWSGSSANVHVRFAGSGNDTVTVLDTSDAATINLGSVATNGNYVTGTRTFSATIVRSADGASIIVTLGTPSGVRGTAVTAKNMVWTIGAGIRDLVGNSIATPATWTESDNKVDF